MCLGIPGCVLERGDDGLAKVDFGGVRRSVSIALTPDVEPGEWVLVHVGFALMISVMYVVKFVSVLRKLFSATISAPSFFASSRNSLARPDE